MLKLWPLVVLLPSLAFARPAPVGVDSVSQVEFTQTVPLVGQVIAANAGGISATQPGQVTEISVKVGDVVKQGDTLLTQDRARLAARVEQQRALLAQASAQRKLANVELQRLNDLRGKAAFSQAEADRRQSALDSAIAQLAAAEANLKLAQIDLDQAEITAPYDAVISAKHTQLGAWLNPGQVAFELVSVGDNELVVDVPSQTSAGLVPGQIVSGQAASGSAVDLKVRAVLPVEDGATRTRPVRFSLTDNLAVGARVTVNVPVSAPREVVSVHKDAILRQGPQAMVYVVEEGVANMRPVVLGESVGNRLEVLNGLVEGEVVVIKGNERLRPGQEVAPSGDPS